MGEYPFMINDLLSIVTNYEASTGRLGLEAQVSADCGSLGKTLEFLPSGFDVSWSKALLPSVAVTVGYLIPCLLIGYFCLKLRELEQK